MNKPEWFELAEKRWWRKTSHVLEAKRGFRSLAACNATLLAIGIGVGRCCASQTDESPASTETAKIASPSASSSITTTVAPVKPAIASHPRFHQLVAMMTMMIMKKKMTKTKKKTTTKYLYFGEIFFAFD